MLPEMFTTPYQRNHMLRNKETLGDELSTTANLLSKLAKETQTYIIGGSIPEMISDDRIYNTCLCFDKNGNITA